MCVRIAVTRLKSLRCTTSISKRSIPTAQPYSSSTTRGISSSTTRVLQVCCCQLTKLTNCINIHNFVQKAIGLSDFPIRIRRHGWIGKSTARKQHCFETPSLIGCAHPQIYPWIANHEAPQRHMIFTIANSQEIYESVMMKKFL